MNKQFDYYMNFLPWGFIYWPLKFMSIVPSGKYLEVPCMVLPDMHGGRCNLDECNQDGDRGMNLQ